MKTFIQLLAISFLTFMLSCSSDSMEPIIPDDSNQVSENFAVLKTGTLTPQSSTNTRGMVQLVRDEDNKFFIRLSDDFTTKFSTGTVTVYLSTSQSLNLNNTSTYQLVSIVGKSGEHFFSLPGMPDEKFTHGIIWCGAAGIPFGFAPMN
ncbi:MAG TPA: hypothetical protein DEQ87_04805 [Algoriphagus sp.]|jgi:hypothetical protein|uniref:DM13 domain-containing protein n=2 Tax=Algoriphagus TaxID=246875 RepID=UPI000C36C9EE|nr:MULTISPECIES: DM13 domain-containing protein [unclassified Algoriphagus]MAL12892.1 hypothetical protein [Algoriphagus sp.]MAN85682.1 hypothetical protein [Algoriphagus sp.]QYH39166.1 DM13 domain-containing protein [Algoriphagus sp. NBT04N3]HAD50015.1 hypothetical protein [Algoriphagus sp.]HCD86948.1 hypothetical protein [Algoriphagus sp.]